MKLNTERLQLELARHCITIHELCERAGVGYPTMPPIVGGRRDPKPITVGKLAKALGSDPQELILPEEGR